MVRDGTSLEEVAFMLVAATVRFRVPSSILASMALYVFTGTCFRFSTAPHCWVHCWGGQRKGVRWTVEPLLGVLAEFEAALGRGIGIEEVADLLHVDLHHGHRDLVLHRVPLLGLDLLEQLLARHRHDPCPSPPLRPGTGGG